MSLRLFDRQIGMDVTVEGAECGFKNSPSLPPSIPVALSLAAPQIEGSTALFRQLL